MPFHPHELCCCGHTLEEHTQEGCQFHRQYGPEEHRGKNCSCKQFVWTGAAPELLNALKELAHQVQISNAIDDHGHALKNLKALHDAEAAIRKAKGESQ
jgi:hypothetical protein